MEKDNCWQCGHRSEASLFCRFCNALQPPVMDYYRFLGMPRRLRVDAAQLEATFYQLSRLLHPDRYLRRTPRERQYSLEATAILNDAYRILRDPVKRAEYVLSQEGFNIGEQRGKDVPPELLEEVFELNEALEELRGGDESARPELEKARERFLGMRQEADRELDRLYAEFDQTGSRETLARIRAVLNRRRYISNLVGEVEKELL
jgi:molecular chaperone HscB